MQLSVIILNYNVRHFLEICVLSVQRAIKNIDAEIIVVDNNSTDDSCEMMKTHFPNIKLIQNKENLGFPKGNNIGVKVAKGEFICILNPDTVVAEDTFEKIILYRNSLCVSQLNDSVGIIGVKLIDGTGNFLPESKRGVPTPWVAFTKITGLYKVFPKSESLGKYYAQHLNENESGKVDILVGAFMFMKKDLYNEVGGFDENCFMYSDDIDLSYMVLQKEKSNYYFHETTVVHYKGESTIKDGFYMKRFQDAMQFFYKKHFKVSFLFNLFMKIGIVLFSILKRFQGVSRIRTQPKSYILFSSSDELVNKMTFVFRKKIELKDLKTEKKVNLSVLYIEKGMEVIMDFLTISFKEIIIMMEYFKNKDITFKIIHKNSNFIIGSNSRNERGEIVKIE